jgi:hypothetical protein
MLNFEVAQVVSHVGSVSRSILHVAQMAHVVTNRLFGEVRNPTRYRSVRGSLR